MHKIIFDLRNPLVIKDNKFKVEVYVNRKDYGSATVYEGWVHFTKKNIIHLDVPELGIKYTVQVGEPIKEVV